MTRESSSTKGQDQLPPPASKENTLNRPYRPKPDSEFPEMMISVGMNVAPSSARPRRGRCRRARDRDG
jgi:hypothetical protein